MRFGRAVFVKEEGALEKISLVASLVFCNFRVISANISSMFDGLILLGRGPALYPREFRHAEGTGCFL